MPQARSDSMLQLTENRETLIRETSEHAAFARTVEIGQFYIANETVVDANSSTLICRECSEPLNSQGSRLQSVLNGRVKIGPVTGIEVFKSARTLVVEVQVPSQQSGNSKSWVRISRGIEQHARHCILAETDHQHIEAASQQSMRCGRPRVKSTGGTLPVRDKAALKQSSHQFAPVNEFGNGSPHKR